MSQTPEHRLGVGRAQNEMNMGPIERIHLSQLNTHRIRVNITNHIDGLCWVSHRLGQVHHLTEPLDMILVLGVESTEELGGVGHFYY